MCPVCWASAFAAWSALATVGMLGAAVADRLSRLLMLALGVAIAVNRSGIWMVPGWCLAGFMAAALIRSTYVVVVYRERWLFSKVWPHACQFAANHCPRYRSINQPSSRMSTAMRQRDDQIHDSFDVAGNP